MTNFVNNVNTSELPQPIKNRLYLFSEPIAPVGNEGAQRAMLELAEAMQSAALAYSTSMASLQTDMGQWIAMLDALYDAKSKGMKAIRMVNI